ncbi:MAG TPA: HNH endonuclease [Candidatus Krumholzibacteria bacterium]|nr:HNH endonuclease [Candidatus Krumholzibacteria bacterium]
MGPTLLRPVLVLDAGYQAVNVVPMRRALRLIATGKAVAVEEDPAIVLRSERASLNCPRIIRLFIAVAHRVYRTLQVRFNKRNVMARDHHRCQYCGSAERLTIDHVVPRSRRTREHPRGGPTSWDNCVTACLACNLKKGDRTPDEAGMELRSKPTKPRWFLPLVHRTARNDGWAETWGRYLGM